MDKMILLAKGNVRKVKGQMAILAILFLVASMLLVIGLSVMIGFGPRFDELSEELNTSETVFMMPERSFTPEVETLFYEYSTEFEVHSGIQLLSEITWNDDKLLQIINIHNMEDSRNLSQWKLVGEQLSLEHNSIYVPYMLHHSAGYNLGDVITLITEGQTIYFTIAGFVENIWSSTWINPRIYVSPNLFEELYLDFQEHRGAYIYANGIGHVQNFQHMLSQETGISNMAFDPTYWLTTNILSEVRNDRTGMATMVSVLMVVFTLIISIVSILVIRFRIKNTIEEDMPNIGSLMSVGYTSHQITGSFVVQYVSIVFFAVVAGILPGVLFLPLISRYVLAALSGIHWQSGFMFIPVIVTISSLTLLVLIFTRLSAGSVRRVTPVMALRGGIKTHSFKRNPLPLSTSPFTLNASLAFESVLQEIRQSTMMFFIMLAVSLTAIIALLIFYNSSVNLTTFEQVPGIERQNALIIFTPNQDNRPFQVEVNTHENVRDSQFYYQSNTIVSGVFSGLSVMEDYNRRVTQNIVNGIFPRYDNEIALTWLLSEELNVSIGDLVYLGEEEISFLVTGIATGFELGPFGAYLTFDGLRKISPDTVYTWLAVYLYPGTDASVFAEEMENQFADYIFFTIDIDEQFAQGVGGFSGIMSLVGIVIIVLSAFIILMVLYFVISSTIVRKHRELGIKKAIGYTTSNLMIQMSLTFSFPILLGTATGTLLGILTLNPIMTMGMRPMGVMQANFIINVPWAIIGGIVIAVLAYTVSLLVTWRIRKISAYQLITE